MLSLTQLMDEIYGIYVECDIHDFPIDCIKILKHYNFKLKTYSQLQKKNIELHKLCLSYSNDAFSVRNMRLIAYNDRVNKGRIRFSLMHELGHFMLKHAEESPEAEYEADLFASHILAPRSAMVELECNTADKIHDTFGISYAAANRCLTDCQKCIMNDPSIIRDQKITKLFPATQENRDYENLGKMINELLNPNGWMCINFH